MAELPDDSVDLVLTSPPFLALRSYLPADHPNKDKEISSESTPAEFVDVLLRLTAEWRRLLTPHGSICIELGDTYSGSGGAGGDYADDGLRDGQPTFKQAKDRPQDADGGYQADQRVQYEGYRAGIRNMDEKHQGGGPGWPLAKSLTLIPEAYRFALAYGINPHTGQPSPAGQWRVRNVIRWVRPNPPVGSLGDKFRPATSELVVACVSKDRHFDLDSVREPHQTDPSQRTEQGPRDLDTTVRPEGTGGQGTPLGVPSLGKGFVNEGNPAGAPPLDWWKISPKGYAGAHYAVWPSELCVKPIKAMSPVKVCRECGEPSRRITDVSYEAHQPGTAEHQNAEQWATAGVGNNPSAQAMEYGRATKVVNTLGWSDCGHDNWRPGLVLDPFAGTGTTLAVAHGHGRDAIGIDIDEGSAELARDRVGPLFLDIIHA